MGKVSAEDDDQDLFWVSVDSGSWIKWNRISSGGNWQWGEVHDSDNGDRAVTFNLSGMNHTIDIAHREPGAKLDRLYITSTGAVPQ